MARIQPHEPSGYSGPLHIADLYSRLVLPTKPWGLLAVGRVPFLAASELARGIESPALVALAGLSEKDLPVDIVELLHKAIGELLPSSPTDEDSARELLTRYWLESVTEGSAHSRTALRLLLLEGLEFPPDLKRYPHYVGELWEALDDMDEECEGNLIRAKRVALHALQQRYPDFDIHNVKHREFLEPAYLP
jgi:hypothetical protein